MAHQDWRGLAAWVRSLPLRSTDLVNEEGKLGQLGDRVYQHRVENPSLPQENDLQMVGKLHIELLVYRRVSFGVIKRGWEIPMKSGGL